MAGRPPRQDPETLRAEVLATARVQIAEGGLQSLSWRKLARAAGYSPSTLYVYFADKQALVDALIAETVAQVCAVLRGAPAAYAEEAPLVAMGLAWVRFAVEEPEAFDLLQSVPSGRRGLDEPVASGEPYAILLGAARAAFPGLATEAVEHATYAFWAYAQGAAGLQRGHLRGFDADFVAADRAALRAMCRGFAAVSDGA